MDEMACGDEYREEFPHGNTECVSENGSITERQDFSDNDTTPTQHSSDPSGSLLTQQGYIRAISFDELLKAEELCRRGVMWKGSVLNYDFNRYKYICKLSQDLHKGTYKLQPYQHFHINDPKPRDITATRFRDRIFQKSLCNNGLCRFFQSKFIYDNSACQENKGPLFALRRIRGFLIKHFREFGNNEGYFLKMDVKHYFQSTPHENLKRELVNNGLQEENFKKRVFDIIDSFEDNRTNEDIQKDPFGVRGIALGSQISQFLQLFYLSSIDHYLKERMNVQYYHRYMDDFIVISDNVEKLHNIKDVVIDMLEEKGLELNEKTAIGKLKDGFSFLKTRFRIGEHGRVMVKMDKKSINKEIRKNMKQRDILGNGESDKLLDNYIRSNSFRMSKKQKRLLRNSVA